MDVAGLGKNFLADTLAQLPDDLRETLSSVIEKPEAAPLLEAIGQGAKRQSDYSREMDRLKTIERQQVDWFAQAKPLAELGEAAQKAGWSPGLQSAASVPIPVKPAELPPDVVRVADLEAREMGVVNFIGYIVPLAQRHQQMFGDTLDAPALVARATRDKVTLDQAYNAMFADQLKAHQQKITDADFEKKYQERRAAESKGNPSFPGAGRLEPGSPLDALEPAKPGVDVGDLVDAYNEAVAATTR